MFYKMCPSLLQPRPVPQCNLPWCFSVLRTSAPGRGRSHVWRDRGSRGNTSSLSLLPQSVSALVDKFKKNDQVFDIHAEVEDSDGGDSPDGPLEDDFDASGGPDLTASGEHTELRSWREPTHGQSCQ